MRKEFTWNNGRLDTESVFLRLDRAICNEAWTDFWGNTSCTALVRTQSDHHPLLVTMDTSGVRRTTSFKFFKTWVPHDECRPLIISSWQKHVVGSGMHRLQSKLLNVKKAFRIWNKAVFGDVQNQVKLAADEVTRIQNLIDASGLDSNLHQLELHAQLALTRAMNFQDQFWREKARNQSFIYGDRNTAYFHRMARIKASSKPIPTEIEEHVLTYFQNIFGGVNNCIDNGLVAKVIPTLVSIEENAALIAMPLFNEIKNAVFDMNADGAPGHDGFGGHFYQHFWDIVGVDVVSSVQQFFYTGHLIPNLNANILVLLPKVPGAASMGDFRPIALANFQFKVITKILADRLALICMCIISPQQRGFVRDRNISDCVIIASEVINSLSKKQYGGNIAIKVDIRKAFDTLDWNFLVSVLKQFGFSNLFCDWIFSILRSAHLSILVNGKAVGYFSCTRGVRQGDPLSPLLFCLAEECLSRFLELERVSNSLQPMSYCRGISLPTHVLYADDVFICCVGSRKNIRCLLHIFQTYSDTSGQLVNFDKSKMFTGAMTVTRRNMLSHLSGFAVGSIPFQYLGCPIFQGKPKCSHFQPIVDRIKVKLATWKGVLLSIMGRVQLVKSIIHGMLVYSFHIYRWPISLLKMLDRWIKNFVWSGDISTRKVCTVSWNQVCLPWEFGGLDLKSTRTINSSLLLHRSWCLFTQDSQCSRLFQQRFLSYGLPRTRYFKSSIWPGVSEFLNVVTENSVWIIGNGNNINLWLDNWMDTSLVSLLNVPRHMFPSLTVKLSTVIVDGTWQIPRPLIDFPNVAAQALSITLPVTPLPDKRVWKHATDGVLTARLAHLFLRPNLVCLDWPVVIWRTCIPPSHSFVFWRMMLSKLPTDENLRMRGCTLVSVCVLCFKQAETSSHLFLECDFAVSVWRWLSVKLQCNISLLSFSSILDCIPPRCSSQVSDVFAAALVHTVHTIWLARNAIRFSSLKATLHNTFAKISTLVTMSGVSSTGNCVIGDVDLLHSLLIPPSHRRVRDIVSVIWKPPTITWVKANTDGSVIGINSSCGGIFRDFTGAYLGGFSSNLGEGTVFEAELTGLMLAMEYAARHNWSRLWLESDSSGAVHAFKNHSAIPMRFRNRWHNCMQLGLFVICSHIYREGNGCADAMASLGHELTDTTWFHIMPVSLSIDFTRDRNGMPNFRFP
ncbi:uncharacterized protein [Medicago truncatula]|uniref:uncharacterized protein n=1 Tax=Medicago truncatula TaxID=3880 RepID=UPI0000D5D69F|nr:uncharacterized protein LOC112419429 [Medicago truncatula]